MVDEKHSQSNIHLKKAIVVLCNKYTFLNILFSLHLQKQFGLVSGCPVIMSCSQSDINTEVPRKPLPKKVKADDQAQKYGRYLGLVRH